MTRRVTPISCSIFIEGYRQGEESNTQYSCVLRLITFLLKINYLVVTIFSADLRNSWSACIWFLAEFVRYCALKWWDISTSHLFSLVCWVVPFVVTNSVALNWFCLALQVKKSASQWISALYGGTVGIPHCRCAGIARSLGSVVLSHIWRLSSFWSAVGSGIWHRECSRYFCPMKSGRSIVWVIVLHHWGHIDWRMIKVKKMISPNPFEFVQFPVRLTEAYPMFHLFWSKRDADKLKAFGVWPLYCALYGEVKAVRRTRCGGSFHRPLLILR